MQRCRSAKRKVCKIFLTHLICLSSRIRSGSDTNSINGIDHADVERLKQEILIEIRKEVQKMKLDIIDGEIVCS